jgi:threonylcarbamoyladenosine tRNA methylthiotransferase CDKAL1
LCWKVRVLVKSYGCSTNLADGAVLAGCIARAGHELADTVSSADAVVLNTCAVKGPTENRMIDACKRIPLKKKLIVAGCLPLIDLERLQKEVRFNGVVGPAAGEKIVEVLNLMSRSEKIVALDRGAESLPRLDLPRVEPSPVISVVPVSYGCLGSCTYCCVVFARGRLRSYETEDVVERVREGLAGGFREFWVTSQDTACYGKDRGTSLAALLRVLSSVDGDFRVRVGMMNPNNVSDMLDELVESFRDERIFKFIHLPVQSGDDGVLKRMRRFYKVSDFRRVVGAFRASFPNITLATDVICGFPGESEDAFERTLQLMREIRPDVVNVSKFFPRPRTLAARLQKDFVSSQEIKRRSTRASVFAKKISAENNQQWVGWTGEVLVDEVGKVQGSWVGRNFAYKPVVVKSDSRLIGRVVHVKVVKAFSTYLEGNVT